MFLPENKILLAVLLCCAQTGFAESADRDKPINLEADQVLVDDSRQTSTFSGNVRLSQGTLLIRGDKIIVEQGKDGFKRATAYGQTADFRQKQEGFDTYVEGYGERIEYDSNAELMDIYGQALIKRGLDEVRGQHITYNTKTEIFRVNGDNTGADGVPPQRVRAVLQPKTKGDSSAPAPSVVPGNSPPLQNQHE